MFKFGPVSSFVAAATPVVSETLQIPKVDIRSTLASFFERMKPGYQAKMDRQKLATVFQLHNEVLELATRRVFTVFDLKEGVAFLIDAHDNVKMVDWHTSAGQLKGYIADDWELVKAAQSQALIAADWQIAGAAHA